LLRKKTVYFLSVFGINFVLLQPKYFTIKNWHNFEAYIWYIDVGLPACWMLVGDKL